MDTARDGFVDATLETTRADSRARHIDEIGGESRKEESIDDTLETFSDDLSADLKSIFMVLAAGHGKRLRSSLPKVMHPIWGVPSLERVIAAAEEGLETQHEVIVVGRKAQQVIRQLGPKPGRVYAYQDVRLGTGHAVQVGLRQLQARQQAAREKLSSSSEKDNQTRETEIIATGTSGTGTSEIEDVILYVLPGDMGLLSGKVLSAVRECFEAKRPAMVMLTGRYKGALAENYYGRVVCVPNQTRAGMPAPEKDRGKVMAIVQYQDLRARESQEELVFTYNGHDYAFSPKTLLALRHFDAGVFAFSLRALEQELFALSSDNVQHEIYLTDLVMRFNEKGLAVESVLEEDSELLLGFNDKTVWRQMEAIFRNRYYERLRNCINIEDKERFYIHEKVVQWIEHEDRVGEPLDITLGAGVYIGPDVELARGVSLGSEVVLQGHIVLHENVSIGRGAILSCFPEQRITLNPYVSLKGGNIIKGSVTLHEHVHLSEGANITGSSHLPTEIGQGVRIFGSCYIYGCQIDPEAVIESCMLICKHVRARRVNGKILPIKYIVPEPMGKEAIEDI